MAIKFVYSQNNSNGQFVGPERVVVIADTPEQANELALAQGVYFDGVEKGFDCECCGDRWTSKTAPDFQYLDEQLGG